MSKSPTVRLAVSGTRSMTGGRPTVHLAHGPGAQGDNVLKGRNGMPTMPDDEKPALLVSYYYIENFINRRHEYQIRDWIMDSGAFSAMNSGAVIDLNEYIDFCLGVMESDPTLTEIYSLDVMGDWQKTMRNTEEMWRQGVPAIPCFHSSEPWEGLLVMAKQFAKIAIGGVARMDVNNKLKWAAQCFARTWPKKIHGFALCGEKALNTLPFHSVDSTSWEVGPCKFGRWRAFGGDLSVKGSNQDLRSEIRWYLELEQRARDKWVKEMKVLEDLVPTVPLKEQLLQRIAWS